MRSVNKKVIAIALAGRWKGPEGEERRVERYRELVSLTRKIVHQAEGVLEEMQQLPGRRQARLKRLREILETMAGRVRQVMRQTKARVFQGITQYPHKIVVLKARRMWSPGQSRRAPLLRTPLPPSSRLNGDFVRSRRRATR
jgi:hypothetical protein